MPALHPGQRTVRDHPARFKVLACGRRWGKTRLGCGLVTETGVGGGAAWWVAPSYKVAAVGWRQSRFLAQQIPGVVIREADRKIEYPGGGWIQVRSADDPDSLRGEGLNRVVVDECAFIPERAWTEAISPALVDRKGSALLISTPKGRNWFWQAFVRGQGDEFPDWKSWTYPSSTNPFLAPDEVERFRQQLPERVYRQELLAEFLDDAGGVFRGVQAVVDSGRRENEPYNPGRTYTLGVDLARVEDFTVLSVFDNAGRQVYHDRFNQISWERQITSILSVAAAYRAAVVLDSTGVGDPIWERLRAIAQVEPYQFTAQSKERLIDHAAMAVEQGRVRLMDIPEQTNELLAYQYELTASRNVRMNAPEGMHDDCVISVSLALWGALEAGYYSAGVL